MINFIKALIYDKEIRIKCLKTFLLLLLIQILRSVPTPGVNVAYFQLLLEEYSSLGFLDSLTGNGLSSLSIMALSITPYITASIVVQLLGITFPRIHDLQTSAMKDERNFIERFTIALGVVLAVVESIILAVGFGSQGLLVEYTWYWVAIITVIWTVAALITSVIGKYITDRCIGNGVSLILAANILSSYFSDGQTLYESVIEDKTGNTFKIYVAGTIVILLAMLFFTVVLQEAEKKIPVVYSSKLQGGEITQKKSVLPLKLCPGTVIPVIFASTLISIPTLIVSALDVTPNFFIYCTNSANWFDPDMPEYSLGALGYILLIFFFTYFYTEVSFNPLDVADNLRKTNGVIPGYRPGKETTDYLKYHLKYTLFIGAFALSVIAIIPYILAAIFDLDNLAFFGTSIMITVGVIFETMMLIKSLSKGSSYISRAKRGGVFND